MSNKTIRCDDCGLEYTDTSNATVCCDSDDVIVYGGDEPETNELGQEKWEVFVEEEIIEAESHLERAIEACEDSGQRGSLLMTYRDIVGFLFRHYDVAYEEYDDE